MSRKHISFSALEAGDAVDEAHLASCGRCRQAYRILSFVRSRLQSMPQLNPPASFASRVAMLVRGNRVRPFVFDLQFAAKRLVPVFAVLVMSTSFLLYQFSSQSIQSLNSEATVEELFEEAALEEAVNSLREFPEEGFLFDESE
jgi:hypothetical protein